MRTHRADRIHQACAVLDLQALGSIRVIAGPGLRHVVEQARIEAAAAARAALEQDMREVSGQAVDQLIQSQHIAVGGFALTLRRQFG
ncbi:hypothetical protein D3C73_1181090 [compost metagenome]